MRAALWLALLCPLPCLARAADAPPKVDDVSGSISLVAPFGLRFGMPAESLESMAPVERSRGNGFLTIREPPREHPSFTHYMVQFGPKAGVCAVRAIGWRFSGREGAASRAAFTRIVAPLATRYGGYQWTDSLDPSSNLREEHQWVESIRRSERRYRAEWTDETSTNLPPGLRAIVLEVVAENDVSGIDLTYVFENFDNCTSEIQGMNDEAL
jgi:hypothetical protein